MTINDQRKSDIASMSQILTRIVSDPGQFINDGLIISHNAPTEERMRVTLSIKGREANLVFDTGIDKHGKNIYAISIEALSESDTRPRIEGIAALAKAANCTTGDMRVALHYLNSYLNDLTIEEHAPESLGDYERVIKNAICNTDIFIKSCKTLRYEVQHPTHVMDEVIINAPACQLRISRVGDLVSINAYLYGASDPILEFGTHDSTKRQLAIDPEGDTEFIYIGINKLIQYAKDYQAAALVAESESDEAVRYLSEKIGHILLWHDFQDDKVTNPEHINAGWGNHNDGVYDFFDCLELVTEAPPKLNASIFLGDEIDTQSYLSNLDKVTLQVAVGGPNAALVLFLDHKSEPNNWVYVFENEINYQGSLAFSEAIGESYDRVRPALADFAENLMSYIRC